MADAAVEFLLQNLKQLLLYNVNLILGVKDHVESLYNELSMLKAFLKDSTEKRTEYETVKELLRQIRDVVFEAEDVIDDYVVSRTTRKNAISRAFDSNLRSVTGKIETIRRKVDDIYRRQRFGFGAIQQQSGEPFRRASLEKKKSPEVEEENVVGFDKEAETLINRLNGGKEELEVVSVIGMGGLGKTTLARKVFNDPAIEYEFFIRAWIYVSQEYNSKEVFLGILTSVDKLTDEMYKWSDERLAEELRRHLRCGRYLIVIDDVWTKEAWDDLKMAFPKNNNRSRILLTSRNNEVAVHANPDIAPHALRFLDEKESWELLEKKVFRKESCPSELVELGKKIAKECDGLPLAIVVIAGLLMKKDKTCDWWEKVAESVGSYVARDPKQCMDILALSYKHLPYHLKACFLYFGAFPKDYEIPVWKLIQLWVAEGFIQQVGEIRLEDTAEDQLEDLVDRNLVLVEKRRSGGGIKTCRVHDMLHDLCLREADEEKFLKEMKGVVEVPCSSLTPSLNKYRRLCIHSRVLDYISSKPSGPHVRSFLCFPLEQGELGREHTSFMDTYKLLRVLDVKSISLPVFPKITQLVHLRYIALYGSFQILPKSISELWNLRTIIIDTSSRSLKVEADIWKMLQLRHFYTNASSHLSGLLTKAWKSGKNPLVRKSLQTISTISPESCKEDILARAPNLRKLGIRGKLAILMERRGGSGSSLFDNLTKLDQLATLKLLNDTFPDPPTKGILPQLYKFPPNLKKLTLADTLLDWEHMSTLGILPKLEVLKLKDNAFRGKCWKTQDGGFRLLRVLQIGMTDLARWEASSHHFPRLQRLVLKDCESLEAVPSGLGDVSALRSIELYGTSSTAVASAKQIQRQQQESLAINRLKLVIYPPDL